MDLNLNQLKKLSLDDNIEIIKPKTSRTVKLVFSNKEFQAFSNAVDNLMKISSTPEFTQCLMNLYPTSHPGQVKTMVIAPLVESLDRIGKRTILKEKKEDNKNRANSFFIKPFPATSKSKLLYSKIRENETLKNLKLNPEIEVSVSDARTYFRIYFDVNNLKTPEGYKINKELQNILPETLKGVKFVSIDEYKKVSIDMAKELIGWVKK